MTGDKSVIALSSDPGVMQPDCADIKVPQQAGVLADNILYFARALRDVGLPIGPRSILDALAAVEAAGFDQREDFRATLHAVFVKKHEHSILFDQAFSLFWRKRGYIEKLIATMSPMVSDNSQQQKPQAAAARIAGAFQKIQRHNKPRENLEVDARFTTSAAEMLQKRDFAQMSADEIALAETAIARLRLPSEKRRQRRFQAAPHGTLIDPRATFRRSVRTGSMGTELVFRRPAERYTPIVALCDISGSMSDYVRMFLHFLHVLMAQRQHVSAFLFGTRLTNVTRALRHKDVDQALADCSAGVMDWSGGTRIGASLHTFNRDWSRRVLGQGAICILFTDGLERDGLEQLSLEAERLHKSCRRLIWVNPLLRYAGFEARASGISIILPQVDEFRPIHNLASMADLAEALTERPLTPSVHPREWLRMKR